jgi:hypothetical protein
MSLADQLHHSLGRLVVVVTASFSNTSLVRTDWRLEAPAVSTNESRMSLLYSSIVISANDTVIREPIVIPVTPAKARATITPVTRAKARVTTTPVTRAKARVTITPVTRAKARVTIPRDRKDPRAKDIIMLPAIRAKAKDIIPVIQAKAKANE